MEATLIQYDTAELAREKGYPHKTRMCFVKRSSYTFSIETKKIGLGDTLLCYQPSQSELERWLRDTQGIQINCVSTMFENGRWSDWTVRVNLVPLKIQLARFTAPTYESVLEIGLQHALRMIK